MLHQKGDKKSFVQKPNTRPKSSQQLNLKAQNQEEETLSQDKSIPISQIPQKFTSTLLTKPFKNQISSFSKTSSNFKHTTSETPKSLQANQKPVHQQKERVFQQNSSSKSITNIKKLSTSQTLKRITNTLNTTPDFSLSSISDAVVSKNQRPQTSESNKITRNLRPQSIYLKIKSSSEITNFSKEVELLAKKGLSLINLNLETKFLNDKDFLNFCDIMMKVASKIRYFNWSISARFNSEDTCKQIGEIIGKCTSAFSINLNTEDTYFSNKGAFSLTAGLNKLSNLRILQLSINLWKMMHIAHFFKLNECLNNKIKISMQLLKSLQKVNYNGLDWRKLTVLPNLRNYVFSFTNENELKKFEEEMNQRREQLVELEIEKYHEFWVCEVNRCVCFDQTTDKEQIVYQNLLENAIQYSIKNLPYLTSYSDPLLHFHKFPHMIDEIQPLKNILTTLTLFRKSTIPQLIIFNEIIVPNLSLNPKLIFIDLLID